MEAKQYYGTLATASTSGSVALDLNNGNVHEITMTGNITTLTITNMQAGAIYAVSFIQDATGSRVLTVPSNLKVEGGTYVVTVTANARDQLLCTSDGTNLYCNKGADVK
jgi:hypothetical protein